MATKEQLEQYYDLGYFIADDAVDSQMLAALEPASLRAVDKVRSGEVVAGQDSIGTGGPGDDKFDILGLIDPEFNEPVFAEYLSSEPLLRHV
jgi:hypothetical protein